MVNLNPVTDRHNAVNTNRHTGSNSRETDSSVQVHYFTLHLTSRFIGPSPFVAPPVPVLLGSASTAKPPTLTTAGAYSFMSSSKGKVVIDLLEEDEEPLRVRRKRGRQRDEGSSSSHAPPAARNDVIQISDDDDDDGTSAAVTSSTLGAFSRPANEITCPICFCEEPPEKCAELSSSCGHAFCVECLTTYVREKVKAGEVLSINLCCPCVEPTRCAVPLTPQDVKRCLETAADVERYERLALQRCVEAEDGLGACPTAGCPFVFAWEEDNRKLECPLCSKTFCLVCRTEPWHRGMRCEQFQAERGDPDASEAAFAAFAKNQKLRQCPKCKFFVQKTSGCDAMHCRCNFIFCYKCGGGIKKHAKEGSERDACRCGNRELLRAHVGAPNHNLRGGGRARGRGGEGGGGGGRGRGRGRAGGAGRGNGRGRGRGGGGGGGGAAQHMQAVMGALGRAFVPPGVFGAGMELEDSDDDDNDEDYEEW